MNGEQKPLIFVSYSHRDDEAKAFIDRHLGVLRGAGEIEVWSDDEIVVGDDWFQEIEANLERCTVAVLLISADFLGSDFCIKKEVPVLLERRKREGMMIAPILLRPCAWQIFPWLAAIQMQPSRDTPLFTLEELHQEQELTKVVIAIHSFLATDAQTVTEAKTDTPYPPLPECAIDLTRLPTSGFDVVGRDEELQFLNEAFDGTKLNVVSLRAWGGVGKSTLVNKWCEYLAADNFRGATHVFAWSFYSQGTNERVTAADAFIDEALRFFGDTEPEMGSPWAKGERLAEKVGREKALLILDGMEPLQDHHQGIKDPALARLVECLAEENAGLCVITTRESVREFLDFSETTHEVDLEQLSKEAGRVLLRIKGLHAADDLLEQASEAFGNHALALNLLANYLKRFAGGDVSQALAIPDLSDISVAAGKHPRRVMAAFAEQFSEGPELDLLHVMGLFDRPADAGCIVALRKEPAIPGLTKRLSALDEIGWRELLSKLRSFGLLAEGGHHAPGELDAHPLMREHFGAQLHAERNEAWKAGHDRLYKHLKTVPEKDQPDTLVEMAPLFQAVHHGCAAEKHEETFHELFTARLDRNPKSYLAMMLGAHSVKLSLLSSFFEEIWNRPNHNLKEDDRASLLTNVGASLRALGKPRESLEPLQRGYKLRLTSKRWAYCSHSSRVIADVYLALGNVSKALDLSELSVEYADRSNKGIQRSYSRANLAHTQLAAGNLDLAESLFIQAEQIWLACDSTSIMLTSYWAFRYADLLIATGDVDKVRIRGIKGLERSSAARGALLDIAFDHLSLGFAAFAEDDHSEARERFRIALDGLRAAGRIDDIPLVLIPRAASLRKTRDFSDARTDLNATMRLAQRGDMRLHECDAHLEYARLAIAEGNSDVALLHFQSAEALVTECGYHRRDGEIAELREKLGL